MFCSAWKSKSIDRNCRCEMHEMLQLKGTVVNDAALRPPTTMAPPVPNKKKISIPSVFLVDDQKLGNGTIGRRAGEPISSATLPPPPRPKRPPTLAPEAGGSGGSATPLKCNGFDLMGSTDVSSSTWGTRLNHLNHNHHSSSQLLSQSPHHTSGYLSMGRLGQKSPPQSQSATFSATTMAMTAQPQPPPRRHQTSHSSAVGVAVATDLHSKCVSVKVIVDSFALSMAILLSIYL